MFLGGDIRRDHERIAHSLRNFLDVLAGAFAHHLLDDLLPLLFAETQLLQRLIEARAGIGEFQILAVVVDVADIGQREDRFTAIAFTACDGGDGAGRGDGGLRGIADAVLLDAVSRSHPTGPRACSSYSDS